MSSASPPRASRPPPSPEPKTYTVGGLPVHVYGLERLGQGEGRRRDVAVLFLLHGRLGRASHPLISTFANRLVAGPESSPPRQEGDLDLVVVTFDQRNHGHRVVDYERNLGWREGGKMRDQERKERGVRDDELDNESHAVDMMAIQTGTARDVSFLIDFLPPVLFPHDERHVQEWYCAGISLGGHATWLALGHDPRISLGIPIIGSPSTLTLLSDRAQSLAPCLGGPLPVSGPFFPSTFVSLLDRVDPSNLPIESTWKGKKVLVLSGQDDELVPFEKGGTSAFVERLRTEAGLDRLDVWVQPNTGHACTPEMMARSTEFVWKHGLSCRRRRGSGGGGGGQAGSAGGKL
ncbi:hypothetical protein JCM10212_001571 [Sporobolomyces blumeae]